MNEFDRCVESIPIPRLLGQARFVVGTSLPRVVLLIAALNGAAARADDVSESALESAKSALESEDYRRAIEVVDGAFATFAQDKLVRLDDEVSPLHTARGHARAALKQWAGAMEDFRRAVELMPEDIDALNWAAWTAATAPDSRVRDGRFAVACSKRVESALKANSEIGYLVLFDPVGVSNLFDTMAAAHAEIGDFKRAVEHQRRALSILETGRAIFGADGPDDERREKIAKAIADFDARMQLYRTGQPYRQQ